tara:strand:- start:1321 stop:1974 length:654 start_codon:yes stop_codon:yes gene_type:complete
MAIGLIKKQIVSGTGASKSPFMKTRNQNRLKRANTRYKREMSAYRGMEFENPYAENVYSNMENKMEDLTVNQQQAQFQAQQNQQSQANILGALSSGGQFNAGNIQALANQSQISAQRASASIGQQEMQNQRLAAQEASRLQTMDRQGRLQVQSGEAKLQQMNADRQATMLGMSMQQVGNAQQAIAAKQAMVGNIVGGLAGAAGSILGGGFAGDFKFN